MQFRHLFSPVNIGGMELRNRLVMSPMTTDYGSDEQEPTERLIRYLEARARGGAGLVTVEVCTVDARHRYQPHSLTLGRDSDIELHRRLTDVIHSHGAKVQPQVTHPGPESLAAIYGTGQSVGPSVTTNAGSGLACRELAVDELPAIIDQYAAAAVRAREAGYDGIELHAAHAYMLLGSFLSPWRNRRTDEYGGETRESRLRLLLEVIRHIKAETGADFPITLRIAGYERVPGGRDVYDTQAIAPLLVEAGVDAFHVSGGVSDKLVTQIVCGSEYPDGYNVPAAAAIRRVVDVPVMVVGRIRTPEQAETILAKGQADLVVMARALLADPELANKARSGRQSDIRRCISCQNCIDSMLIAPFDQDMNCAVNPLSGRETDIVMTPAPVRKRVLVIGGGTAGMEAARVLALRGHQVTLCESRRYLGGSLLLAATVHADNEPFLQWLVAQVRKLPIEVRLGETVSIDSVKAMSVDAVVVATGAKVALPQLPGLQSPHVWTGTRLRELLTGGTGTRRPSTPGWLDTATGKLVPALGQYLTPALIRQATRVWMPLGRRVVIVGADLVAIEVAEFLAHRGREVVIVTNGPVVAPEIGPKRRDEHLRRLDRLGVSINTDLRVDSITAAGVEGRNIAGQLVTVDADCVLVAGEPVADTSLAEQLQECVGEVHAIGDCTGLGLIRKATEDAARAACAI